MTPTPAPGDRSSEILQALWALGRPAAVADVRARLAGTGDELAYTTVQTLLNRLVEQGRAERRREGRAFLYWPTKPREVAAGDALRRLADRFFRGSRAELATHLVDDLDAAELELVRSRIEAALRREEEG